MTFGGEREHIHFKAVLYCVGILRGGMCKCFGFVERKFDRGKLAGGCLTRSICIECPDRAYLVLREIGVCITTQWKTD